MDANNSNNLYIEGYCAKRLKDLNAFSNAIDLFMNKNDKANLENIYLKQPERMVKFRKLRDQRRTTSHKRYEIPRRLRVCKKRECNAADIKESEKLKFGRISVVHGHTSKLSESIELNRCRKHRRRPYIMHQQRCFPSTSSMWMESHMLHCKKFKMVDTSKVWGFSKYASNPTPGVSVPLYANDRKHSGITVSHSSVEGNGAVVTQRGIVFDRSFITPILLKTFPLQENEVPADIFTKFFKCFGVDFTILPDPWEYESFMYCYNQFPSGALGPVDVLVPKGLVGSPGSVITILLYPHASVASVLFEDIKKYIEVEDARFEAIYQVEIGEGGEFQKALYSNRFALRGGLSLCSDILHKILLDSRLSVGNVCLSGGSDRYSLPTEHNSVLNITVHDLRISDLKCGGEECSIDLKESLINNDVSIRNSVNEGGKLILHQSIVDGSVYGRIPDTEIASKLSEMRIRKVQLHDDESISTKSVTNAKRTSSTSSVIQYSTGIPIILVRKVLKLMNPQVALRGLYPGYELPQPMKPSRGSKRSTRNGKTKRARGLTRGVVMNGRMIDDYSGWDIIIPSLLQIKERSTPASTDNVEYELRVNPSGGCFANDFLKCCMRQRVLCGSILEYQWLRSVCSAAIMPYDFPDIPLNYSGQLVLDKPRTKLHRKARMYESDLRGIFVDGVDYRALIMRRIYESSLHEIFPVGLSLPTSALSCADEDSFIRDSKFIRNFLHFPVRETLEDRCTREKIVLSEDRLEAVGELDAAIKGMVGNLNSYPVIISKLPTLRSRTWITVRVYSTCRGVMHPGGLLYGMTLLEYAQYVSRKLHAAGRSSQYCGRNASSAPLGYITSVGRCAGYSSCGIAHIRADALLVYLSMLRRYAAEYALLGSGDVNFAVVFTNYNGLLENAKNEDKEVVYRQAEFHIVYDYC